MYPVDEHDDLEECWGQVVELTLPGTIKNIVLAGDRAALPTLSSGPHSVAPRRLFANCKMQPWSDVCTTDGAREAGIRLMKWDVTHAAWVK